MSRDQEIKEWVSARFAPLYPNMEIGIKAASADASFRRYFRLSLPDGQTRILMDAPPDKEDCRPFIKVARLMTEAGIRAPHVEAADLEKGFLLLTDLGTEPLLLALKTHPECADAWMRLSLDTLVRWQSATSPGTLPPYDRALLEREMQLFPEWYVKTHMGQTLSPEEKSSLKKIFDLLIESALAQPRVFTHRDFMPRNLMKPEPEKSPMPGVLDFQDAVEGPITYDLVSLFRDAFISWDEEQEIDWVVRYWEKARDAKLPVHADFGEFWQAYEWMGLQRHLKVMGIFCRLNYRDGKPHYIADLPRFSGYIRKTAGRYAPLKPLLRLLDRLEGASPQTLLSF